MYASAVDEANGLAVWYPFHPTAAEWEEQFRDLEKVVGWSKRLGFRPAVVLLADQMTRPDAKQRARLAEITGRIEYDPYIAFVSGNAVLRGLHTVLAWMHAKPSYTIEYLATPEAGCAWLERHRGQPLPGLGAMIAEVRAKTTARSPARASSR